METEGEAYVWDLIATNRQKHDLIAEASSQSEKNRLEREMQERKDRNVVVYGMITSRKDVEKVIVAQKFEAPRKLSEKWDSHELRYNNSTNELEYVRSS